MTKSTAHTRRRLSGRLMRLVPGGRPELRKRRGTVLVLILGALALISIVTLVYVSIGQSDRRTATVTVQKDHVETAAQRVSEYAARVIADAVLAVWVDGNNPPMPSGQPVLVRRAADFSYTDPLRLSVMNSAVERERRRFDPTGTFSLRWWENGPDRRIAGSPYLASARPMWLQPDPEEAVENHFRFHRDWYQITNIAPDGRFVNLWNLRNNFDAPSFDSSNLAQPRPGHMNHALLLLDINGNPASPAPGAASQLPFGAGPASANVPAHWTMFQQRAFRLANRPDTWYPGFTQGRRPDHEWYPLYQWADTTGDGFLDSRFFELVDASDPNNILSLLPRDGRYRWFAAARIVDLSSMINVNTATDFRAPPRADANNVLPAGRTPAEIDLRRMLMMTDAYLGFPAGGDPYGYQLLARDNNDPYNFYDQNAALLIGRESYNLLSRWLRPWQTPTMILSGDQRSIYYGDVGSRPRGSLVASGVVELGTLFGAADMLELLTYHGVNSPQSSRLEEVHGGWNALATTPGQLSPLRDNRTLFDERDAPGANPAQALDRSLARSYFDIRQSLTTLSGARPLRSAVLGPNSPYRAGLVDGIDTAVNARAALNQATQANAASRDPHTLFEAYAEALLPHAWRVDAWEPSRETLHYGYSPELALRLAAHLTANMAAAFRTGGEPRAYTLLIDEAYRNDNELLDQTRFPWWTPRPQAGQTLNRPNALDLNTDPNRPSRLAPNDNSLTARAVNIWSAEAHPFLTEVAAFHLYTDTPRVRGGDDDAPDPTIPGSRDQITIDGRTSPTVDNPDFLGHFIAFQLTNPFDETIQLTGSVGQNEYPNYYIEWGGYLFRLENVRGGGPEAITLEAGESRVAVAMSHSLSDIADKWSNVTALQTTTTDDVLRFIDAQMSIGDKSPWIIERMNEETAAPISEATDLFSGGNAVKTTVHLWRTINDSGPFTLSDPEYRAQHLLVDRLRDPAALETPIGPSVLDRRIRTVNADVTGTTSGQEPSVGSSADHDNTGFSIVLTASVRRKNTTGEVPLGGLPAYCMEAQWITSSGQDLQNITERDSAGTTLDRDDFVTMGGGFRPHAAANFDDLLDKITDTASGEKLIETIGMHPKEKDDGILTNLDQNDPRSYNSLYPQMLFHGERFQESTSVTTPASTVSVLRVADMLMPLAIGPSHDPAAMTTATGLYAGWITMSEALALALNYSTPPQADPVFGIWHRVGELSDPILGALDRGNLVLDRFVPHDIDGAVIHRRYPGIPLALNIMNVFSVDDDNQVSMTRKKHGLVNINTASLPVLRTIPMLSPTPEPGQWNAWKSQSPVPTGHTVPELVTDIAAAVQAYRDKVPVLDRGDASTATPTPLLNMFMENTDQVRALLTDPGLTNPALPRQRGYVTQIDAPNHTVAGRSVREQPGIATPGELMAVRSRAATQNSVPTENSIDLLALDGDPSGTRGMATALYKNDQDEDVPNAIPDSWDEQLLIANAALGSISVRSDVFAVWILLHGYQRADTENLGEHDPLVPSIAKRYLMVVDRSNVTRKGQMPEIVLFKEVPIR